MPDFLRNLDDRADIIFVRARGTIRSNFQARSHDLARQRFGVGISARAGAGKSDIHRVDAQRFHQVKNFDFFRDGRIVDGRILQAVAQSLVIQRDAAAGRNFCALGGVPIVNEFVAVQIIRAA